MHVHKEHTYTSYNDNSRYDKTYARNQFPQSVKLLIQRSLYTVIYLCRFKHFAVLSGITDSEHTRNPVPLNYLCATHHMIGRECGFRIIFRFIRSLASHRLSRQCRLIHSQGNSFQQFRISRNLFPRIYHNDVAYNYSTFWHLRHSPITNNCNCFFIIDLIKYGKFLVCLHFKIKGQRRSKYYRNEYP